MKEDQPSRTVLACGRHEREIRFTPNVGFASDDRFGNSVCHNGVMYIVSLVQACI